MYLPASTPSTRVVNVYDLAVPFTQSQASGSPSTNTYFGLSFLMSNKAKATLYLFFHWGIFVGQYPQPKLFQRCAISICLPLEIVVGKEILSGNKR